ncbi:hypothetical protein AMECASPLE_018372 [Ameca splendens]|uniref:Uncharacterized protein n=1 Tax=Ameca splendens TaxID=208324 RepID=A0ABV0XRP0_9TELE
MQTSRQHDRHLLEDLLNDLPGSNPLLQKPHSCQLPQPAKSFLLWLHPEPKSVRRPTNIPEEPGALL